MTNNVPQPTSSFASLIEGLPIDQKDALIQQMAINPEYGCYTRAALEYIFWPRIQKNVEFVFFFDIDDMKAWNDVYKYKGMNQLIKKCLVLRRQDVYGIYQWQSGDELTCFLVKSSGRPEPIKPAQVASRIWRNFQAEGVSITGAIVPVKEGQPLEEVMKIATDLVQEMKHNPVKKGKIYFSEMLFQDAYQEED
jgi:hypothetical protein